MSEKKLEDILGSVPNYNEVETWSHDKSSGFKVLWGETGRGFGEYAFFINKEDGQFRIDNETDGPDTIKRILDRLVDENPEDVKKIFQVMIYEWGHWVKKETK